MTGEERREMLEDARSAQVREAFRASQRAVADWEASLPGSGLDRALDWIDQLRAVFGDPQPDRTPWREGAWPIG